MKVLVLNCGSSSIKYKLYNMDDNSVLAAGGVERIGLDEAFIKVTLPNGEKKKIMHDMPDHKEGVNFVFQCLLDPEIGALCSAVYDLEEELTHSRVYSVADEVCVERLENGLAGQDLCCHSGGVCHTRTANGFN